MDEDLHANEVYDVVSGSHIPGKGAFKGGMPKYKYLSNRALTFFPKLLSAQKLSEFHTGYRVFSANVLHVLQVLLRYRFEKWGLINGKYRTSKFFIPQS